MRYEYSDFLQVEFDSCITPSNELDLSGFRLLDVDNRTVLPINTQVLWSKIMQLLHNEFQAILGQATKGSTILFISLFRFIIFNNTLGLLPCGTPGLLIPFMVLVETLRNIIRPGTLAVRLAANIIAGHRLLTLLGNIGPSLSLTLVSFLMLAQILLLILKSAVAIIQSYVFAVLRTLYAREVN
ncbi:ATP synthase subunit a-like 1 [Homarus americanus]|uniref:F-ATPase protein 6 n=1 Tax=Homarus americanus TaxID=6706 RepID=A0A8J5MYN0_HOMAM|nr:ATP synthase subunit a-like 1 [Homarus americanus]